MPAVRHRVSSAHLLSIIAIVLATCVPAGAAAALITAKQIGNNAVLSRHIKNGQVGSSDLAAGAVKGNNLAAGSVGSVQVADGSIGAADLAPGTIPAAGPTVVTASMLATGSVTETSIATGAVSTRTLADGAVATAKLADGSITSAKLAAGAVTATQLADGSVGTTKLADGAVTSAKLADGSINTAKLAAGSVTGGTLGTVVGVGVTASAVAVPNDTLDTMPAEEADGYTVSFDSELFDTSAMWSSGAPTDIVVPTDGLYQVEAWVSWEAGSGYREVQLLQDGTIVSQERGNTGTSMGNRLNQSVTGVVDAQAGDVLALRISHQAGSTLNADRIRVTVHRLGTSA